MHDLDTQFKVNLVHTLQDLYKLGSHCFTWLIHAFDYGVARLPVVNQWRS